MNPSGPDELLHVLQFAISPAVLVTAVGLLLGPATVRLGRAIDRCRSLGRELETAQANRAGKLEQLRIVHERAHMLRRCIACYAGSLFLSCLIVLLLFLKVLFGWGIGAAVVVAFGLNVLALMAGAALFLLDIAVGLRALDIEVASHLK
jgi:hypothetical protein